MVSDNFERMTIEQLQKWYDNSGVNASTAKVKIIVIIPIIIREYE